MKITPTGIAIALALVVVATFFIFPGLFPFKSSSPSNDSQAQVIINTQTASTMPTEPVKELMMKDDVVGTGATASSGDSVTVNYVGALTKDTVFGASASL